MNIKICANCETKTNNVKAYVGKQQMPLCEKCWKSFVKGEITLETLEKKAGKNE